MTTTTTTASTTAAARPAIWFSRHRPTAEQLAEIASKGYALHAIEEGIALGGRNLNSEEDVASLMEDLAAVLRQHKSRAIFGVIPAPLMVFAPQSSHQFDSGDRVFIHVAWNIMRTVEGGKPTFEHKCWVDAGRLDFTGFGICDAILETEDQSWRG